MRLVSSKNQVPPGAKEIETVNLSQAQLAYVAKLSHDVNPEMPTAIGVAHVIRELLARIEETGIDLTDANSEEELTRIATDTLRWRNRSKSRR
jgi:hypothetical protein